MDVDAGYSLPMDYGTNDFVPGPYFKGKGLGMDVGITYTQLKSGIQDEIARRNCENPYLDYEWRIGISLLDTGSIDFKNSAEFNKGRGINVFWIRWIQSMQTTSISLFRMQVQFYLETRMLLWLPKISVLHCRQH
jgi:hypothetical protein